jgi:hypothetical protein
MNADWPADCMLSILTVDHMIRRIQHPSQLTALAGWRIIPSRTPDRFILEVEGPPEELVIAWERQLSQLRNACGCEQGALGLITGAVGYVLYLFLRSGGWGHPGWKDLWVGLGVLVVTTSVAKFLGLLVAQRKLKRLIKEIQARWKPRPFEEQDSRSGGVRRRDTPVWRTRCCGG